MEFLNDIKTSTLIITNNSNKKQILKELSKKNYLLDIKISSLKEIIERLTFTYDEKAIYYLTNNLKIKPQVAEVYLNNLKYIEKKEYKNKKLIKLQSIKELLDNNNLLIYDALIKQELKTKEIIIYGYNYFTKFETKIISKLKELTKVTIIEKQFKNYKPKVYYFDTQEEEIEFVAQKISELINNNVSLNDIKITNLKDYYYNDIKRIFKFYNLPLEINDNSSIYGTNIVQDFLKNYANDLTKTFEILKDKYKENELYNTLIDICNKYYFEKDKLKVKDLIINDLKKTKIKEEKYNLSIQEIDYKNDYIKDSYHVFMLNFNEGEIPITYKDEEYLTDNMQDEVLIETTTEKNKQSKISTINNIRNIKNLTITYKLSGNKKTYYKSNLINELSLEEEKKELNYDICYSTISNKLKLSELLDNLITYNEYDKNLDLLYSNYEDIEYLTFDNKFKGINKEDLKKYLNNNLTLSYSSLDNYYKCGFKYYIANILKIDIFNETYYTFIGNLFHHVLEKYYTGSKDYLHEIDLYLKESKRKLTNKETFFLEKLTEELKFIITTIDEQLKPSKLDKILAEEKITIEKNAELKITFKGYIDKILYEEKDGYNLTVLIDYKTGDQDIDLSLVPYGLSMQLPIYLYLAKNSKLKNIKFIGFYLQKILHNEISYKENKKYEDEKRNNLKLQGYTIKDETILKEFDPHFNNSSIIKGLKTTVNNDFFKSSKMLSEEDIDNLINLVEEKINLASKEIINANFSINPKIINDLNRSCPYCKFKDICFVKDKDKIIINKD